ncbi:hypothetical protein ACIQF6_34345 [Kitasatospora sp. NPDC092948]|uniref:hypothetical protein n=1 Tax=Kitasatospora sp. NPDC092948 TaxID=3364088 RepID=UPI003819B5B8
MGERERRVAALLLGAEDLQRAQQLLFQHAQYLDLDLLGEELLAVQRQFEADGQPRAAALAGFHLTLVQDRRDALRAADELRTREPADTWQHIERQAEELIAAGAPDAALDLVRDAARTLAADSYAAGRLLGVQWLIAEALHHAGRSREGLELLDSLDLDLTHPADTLVRTRLHHLRGRMYRAQAAYEHARAEFARALDAARAVGSVPDELTVRLALAESYLDAGRSRDAVRELRRLVARAGSWGAGVEDRATALGRLGTAYRAAGDPAAARACHRRVLKLTGDAGPRSPARCAPQRPGSVSATSPPTPATSARPARRTRRPC